MSEPVTAETITDEQIHETFQRGRVSADDAAAALHGWPQESAPCRERCATAYNAMIAARGAK